MKREYQKPYLAMESFQLDAAVAASCSKESKQPIHFGLNACKLGDDAGEPDEVYFGAACSLDVVSPNGGDGNDTICYHGPVTDVAEFFVCS